MNPQVAEAKTRAINIRVNHPIRWLQASYHLKFTRLRNGLGYAPTEPEILRFIENPAGPYWRRPVYQPGRSRVRTAPALSAADQRAYAAVERSYGGHDYGLMPSENPGMVEENRARAGEFVNKVARRLYRFVSVTS